VGPDNKSPRAIIEATRTLGDQWVVQGGLNEGERVNRGGGAEKRSREFSCAPSRRRSRRLRGNSMAKFFIDRPIFAIVIALIIMLAGGLSILTLPIDQYPPIAPPTVQIGTTYPGASQSPSTTWSCR